MLTSPTRSTDVQATANEPTAISIVSVPTPTDMEFRQEASLTGSPEIKSAGQFAQRTGGGKPISIDVLYQAREAGSMSFNRALELLGLASESLSEAREAIESGDRVARASEVLRFEQLLQPLFECRAIGEGFSNVINSIHISIANLQGEPLSDAQINTLWRVIREVSLAPFLSFSESLVFVRQLGKVGLSLNNEFISEWASESSTIDAE
jgi:hypothetical protein